MHTMRLFFSLLVVSVTVSSVHALEWVEYEGTIPENAVSVNEGTEDRPVCRRNSRIGIVNDSGRCRSVRIGGEIEGKREFEILVDNTEAYSEIDVSGYEEEIAVLRAETEDLQNALAQSTDGMVTQADFDTAVEEAAASAKEGMVTQADFDAAVAEATASATEGMVTQADFDAAVAEAAASAKEGMVTQADFDAAMTENSALEQENSTLASDNAILQEQNEVLEEVASSSGSSTDDVWSYDSQRAAILSISGSHSCAPSGACMRHDFRAHHLEYLDEDSSPVTMYDIALANKMVTGTLYGSDVYPTDACGYGTTTWIEHLIEAGIHPQLAVVMVRFMESAMSRGTNADC